MSPKLKTRATLTAVVVCGIVVTGAVVVYQKNTGINYVTHTSIFASSTGVNTEKAQDSPQQSDALSVQGPVFRASIDTTTMSTSLSTSNEATIPEEGEEVTVMLNAGPENATESVVAEVDKVTIPVYTKGTVLSAMEAYRDADRAFSFNGTLYPVLGFFVEKVRGIGQGDGKYWILYVNDESSDLGASRTVVMPGDVVEWRLDASPF